MCLSNIECKPVGSECTWYGHCCTRYCSERRCKKSIVTVNCVEIDERCNQPTDCCSNTCENKVCRASPGI